MPGKIMIGDVVESSGTVVVSWTTPTGLQGEEVETRVNFAHEVPVYDHIELTTNNSVGLEELEVQNTDSTGFMLKAKIENDTVQVNTMNVIYTIVLESAP